MPGCGSRVDGQDQQVPARSGQYGQPVCEWGIGPRRGCPTLIAFQIRTWDGRCAWPGACRWGRKHGFARTAARLQQRPGRIEAATGRESAWLVSPRVICRCFRPKKFLHPVRQCVGVHRIPGEVADSSTRRMWATASREISISPSPTANACAIAHVTDAHSKPASNASPLTPATRASWRARVCGRRGRPRRRRLPRRRRGPRGRRSWRPCGRCGSRGSPSCVCGRFRAGRCRG
jgi:hypothetical protein